MKISHKKFLDVFSKTNFKCAYCGKTLNMNLTYKKEPLYNDDFTKILKYIDVVDPTKIDYAIEHIKPVSKGGTNDITNLLPSCKKYNSTKGTKSLEDFRQVLTFRKNNIPVFTPEQIDYLSQKIDLSKLFPQPIKFYFEEINMESK